MKPNANFSIFFIACCVLGTKADFWEYFIGPKLSSQNFTLAPKLTVSKKIFWVGVGTGFISDIPGWNDDKHDHILLTSIFTIINGDWRKLKEFVRASNG